MTQHLPPGTVVRRFDLPVHPQYLEDGTVVEDEGEIVLVDWPSLGVQPIFRVQIERVQVRFQVHTDPQDPAHFAILDTDLDVVVSDGLTFSTASFRAREYECGNLAPDQHFIG